MRKLLVGAGVATLLVGAQAAVSAAYNPMDRVSRFVLADATASSADHAPAKSSVGLNGLVPSSPSERLAGQPAPSSSHSGSEEVPGAPRTVEPRVGDRVATGSGRYNLALSAYSQEETCIVQTKFVPSKEVKVSGPFGSKCDGEPKGSYQAPTLPIMFAAVALAAVVVVADDGESD